MITRMSKSSLFTIFIALGCYSSGSNTPSTVAVSNEQSTPAMPSESECASAASSIAKTADTSGDRKKVRSAVTRRCTEDRWSHDAVACFANITDDGDGRQVCVYKHLTGEQKDKLEKAWADVGFSASSAMAMMNRFKNEMCLCQDATCAKNVSDEMTKWAEQFRGGNEPKMTEADQKRATEIGMAMAECMTRTMNMPPPTP
jgi:hypothetical protein